MDRFRRLLAGVLLTLIVASATNITIGAPDTGGVENTRHNMSQSFLRGGSANMDTSRNDYGEVCVYCHTPHAASTTTNAPLWNRTMKNTVYQTYGDLIATGQTPSQPGVNSLVCLSCHDGTVAIDSIINMPGPGRHEPAQETSQNNGFLDQWTNPSGTNPIKHATLTDCLACHNKDNIFAPDFAVAVIGTDLSNDHPVGVTLPDTNLYGFREPNGQRGGIKFFDRDGNGRPDAGEIRYYNTGGGFKVECGSCHDPHGVSPTGPGGVHNPTFLRVSNATSAVCITCHVK